MAVSSCAYTTFILVCHQTHSDQRSCYQQKVHSSVEHTVNVFVVYIIYGERVINPLYKTNINWSSVGCLDDSKIALWVILF